MEKGHLRAEGDVGYGQMGVVSFKDRFGGFRAEETSMARQQCEKEKKKQSKHSFWTATEKETLLYIVMGGSFTMADLQSLKH